MDQIFSQGEFNGGLDLNLDSTKIARNSATFIANARVRRNTVEPTKKHKKIALSGANYQGIFAAGNWLVAFSDGYAYYWDVTAAAGFVSLGNWPQLDPNVEFIEACVLPASYSKLHFTFDDANNNAGKVSYDPAIPGNPASLFVTDGVNQSRLISLTGEVRSTKTFGAWTPEDPEYVPIGVNPIVSGPKFYLLSPDRRSIYHSVSGRFLDFVINRKSDGTAGGDASTFSKSVDFSANTALMPSQDGGLIVTTLYATYGIVLDYSNIIFGEPYLRDTTLFNVGALSNRAFVDILGDTAFINQEGIQSFNQTQQLKISSNNLPQGAPIARALVQPQVNGACGTWQNYVFFAVDTVYGPCTLVFDTLTKTYVSFDFEFGNVKQFARVRAKGQDRLFFITWNNELYEAFAGEDYATARVYIGEFTSDDDTKMFTVQEAYAGFNNLHGPIDFQISLYCNKHLVERTIKHLDGPSEDFLVPPIPMPFKEGVDADTVFLKTKDHYQTDKCGLLIEWNGKADLTDITMLATNVHHVGTKTLTPSTNKPTKVVAFGNLYIEYPYIVVTSDYERTAVIKGDTYVILGSVYCGNLLYTNERFVAPLDYISVKGTLFHVGLDYGAILNNEKADLYVVNGNLTANQGEDYMCEAAGYLVSEILNSHKLQGVAGDKDLSNLSGLNYFQIIPNQRMYSKRVGNVEFFFIDQGVRTQDGIGHQDDLVLVSSNPFGYLSDSDQARFIRMLMDASTARFKVAVTNYPPYTDGGYSPGSAAMRWNYKKMGFNLVLSGHDNCYERLSKDGMIYLVNGGLWPVADSRLTTTMDVFYNKAQTYITIEADEYNLSITAKSIDGLVVDAFTIPS